MKIEGGTFLLTIRRRARVSELKATTGFEPVIRVLQTLALPLGHVAGATKNFTQFCLFVRKV